MRVEGIVREICGPCVDVVHATRLAAVMAVVHAIIRARRVTIASVGRALSGRARPKHGIKRVDRLLGNPHLAAERWLFFKAIASKVLATDSRPAVIVDWTQMVGQTRALVAAVAVDGRAVPIYAEVHPEKKLGNSAIQRRFLRALKQILPFGCRPIVVTDAGFHGPFFRDIRKMGWDFVGRLRGTAKARPACGGPAISKEQFYARATLSPRDLGQFELYTRAESVDARLVLVRKRRKPGRKLPPPTSKEEREFRQTAKDPWLLVTSLNDCDSAGIVALYAKRMQIEETFRDAKNPRFGWCLRHASSRDPQRLAVLFLLVAIAMLAVTLIGLTAERLGMHRAYQANTERTRVLSFFVLGLAVLLRHPRPPFHRPHLTMGWAAIRELAHG